jgi:hypothetical protein
MDLNQLRQSSLVTEAGEAGRFYICGIPAQSSWINLTLELDRTPVADTSVAPSSIDAPSAMGTRRFDWILPPGALQAAMQGDGATLTGRVTRNGSPVGGAEVWVVFKDTTVRTDSLGRFRIGGLSAGEHLIQVRRIGYTVTRDSVTLKARDVTVKDFVMDGARELDTMRTIGKGRAYDSPRLQDFEKRRLNETGGHFISEDELRKHESRSVADILRSYTPGITFENYRGQLLLSSSSAPVLTKSMIPPNGPTGCWASVYLDGTLLFDGTGTPPDMKQFLAMNLSGVEYYSGAMTPLQYKSIRNGCGTVLLWTRGK